jgi:hypothetical protein
MIRVEGDNCMDPRYVLKSLYLHLLAGPPPRPKQNILLLLLLKICLTPFVSFGVGVATDHRRCQFQTPITIRHT